MSCIRIVDSGIRSAEVIEIDGADITRAVRSYTLLHTVGEVARLELELPVLGDGVTLQGEAIVVIPGQTRQALIDLGWTPPVDPE